MRVAAQWALVWAVGLALATPRPQLAKGPQPRGHARRGVVTPATARATPRVAALVEGSDETVEPYSKNQPGRHVCTQEQAVTEPVRTRESYCRPVYKTYMLPCEQGKMCRRYRVVYETAFRDVLKMRVSHKTSYSCCPGWAQGSKVNHGCTKAVCSRACQNGGACLKPEMCGCRPGYTGKHCEHELDECSTQRHTCDHLCVNTAGSYQCRCREGFELQQDGRSCRSSHAPPLSTVRPAVSRDREEREFEEEDEEERDFSVVYVNLTRRISKLEKLMTKPLQLERSPTSLNEVTAKLDMVIEGLSVLKSRVDRMERRMDHHHKVAARKAHSEGEDARIASMAKHLARLEDRLDECSCTSDSANKIDV